VKTLFGQIIFYIGLGMVCLGIGLGIKKKTSILFILYCLPIIILGEPYIANGLNIDWMPRDLLSSFLINSFEIGLIVLGFKIHIRKVRGLMK